MLYIEYETEKRQGHSEIPANSAGNMYEKFSTYICKQHFPMKIYKLPRKSKTSQLRATALEQQMSKSIKHVWVDWTNRSWSSTTYPWTAERTGGEPRRCSADWPRPEWTQQGKYPSENSDKLQPWTPATTGTGMKWGGGGRLSLEKDITLSFSFLSLLSCFSVVPAQIKEMLFLRENTIIPFDWGSCYFLFGHQAHGSY